MVKFELQPCMKDKPHVLVVDDDVRICDLVAKYLLAQDFIVMTAHDAAQARVMLERFEFDVLVLDVMMPGEGGLNLTRFVRKSYNTPVLLLTAMGEAQDRIAGLESGADDYLSKPFEPKELVLRLQAILRRTVGEKREKTLSSFKIGAWQYDPERDEFCNNSGELLSLTDAEALLIKALALHDNAVVTREVLAKMCDVDADSRSLDVQVTRLRRKIEEDTRNPRYLQTVRGKGYILKKENME